MKSLYLIRHAKSDWSKIGQSDFDRGINDRGKKSIKKIGKYLKDIGIIPDLILSSPAKRAKLTAIGIADILGYKKTDISYYQEIYDGSEESIISLILQQKKSFDTIFMIGHCDEIVDVADYFAGVNGDHMPTCSVRGIKFELKKWKDISYGDGEVSCSIIPKAL